MVASQNTPETGFQSFEERSDPSQVAPRIKKLRKLLANEEIDAFLVPRADEFQGESVPPGSARLAWLTGFTGSAGMAVIGKRRAVLLVDSRYTLQAPAQTDTEIVEVLESPPATLADWASDALPAKAVIGFDPWLLTKSERDGLTARLQDQTLKPVENLVDRLWVEDRPAPPTDPIDFLGLNRTGRSAADKISDLQHKLGEDKVDASVLTLPESACWLFNIRGTDVPNTPVVLGFAIVPKRGKPTLFVVKDKITAKAKDQIGNFARLEAIDKLDEALAKLAAKSARVAIDPSNCPAQIANLLAENGAEVIERRDPVLLAKAQKNNAEMAGMREAQQLDAIAMAKFLCWFDSEAPKGHLTEIGIVEQLEAFRREDPSLVDISFDTISGAGPDGAIVHYRVTEKTDRTLQKGELMLVDSGGQYLSGTTDITRTMATGTPTAEQKDRFTRVLKGMIAISMARFPKGTTGSQIDVLARQFLWQAGVSYSHGTGHGVGAFLGVHEGPVSISPRPQTLPLQAGMILSNEPGYYKAGEYGIRIENLIHVVPSTVGENFLEFETLTLTPIDRRLIDETLLTEAERNWLNAYHARVFKEIGGKLAEDVRAWLQEATAPI